MLLCSNLSGDKGSMRLTDIQGFEKNYADISISEIIDNISI